METEGLHKLANLLLTTMPEPDATKHATFSHKQLLSCLLEREAKVCDRQALRLVVVSPLPSSG